MTDKEMMQLVQAQEDELHFTHFDAKLALKIGLALIEEAGRRGNKIDCDIAAFGRTLFHYCDTGCAPSNDNMIERKKRTALYTGHSSFFVHWQLRDFGMSIEEKWALPLSEYAQVGGAFPVRLVNTDGVIGTITVSGFPHETDHGIIVDVLRSMKDEI